MDIVIQVLDKVFGGDIPRDPLALHQIAARAVVVYIIGMAVVRLGKSRLISHITPIDVILGFILGSLLSRGITGSASISGTTVASLALIATHWLFTLTACRWPEFGNLIKGHSVVLVRDGHIDHKNMAKSHISQHDLEEALRLKGFEKVADVRLAYKERNGEISILE